MDSSISLQAAGAVVSIAILCAGAVGGLISMRLIKFSALRVAFDDLKRVADAGQSERELMREELADIRTKLEAVISENRTLKELVTQAAKVDSLAAKIDKNHGELLKAITTKGLAGSV